LLDLQSDVATVSKTAAEPHALLIAPVAQNLATLHAKTLMLSLHDVLRYSLGMFRVNPGMYPWNKFTVM
jgi:hypothetical protein